MYVGSEDNHRTSHLICVTVSSGCRAAGAWSNPIPPYLVSCRTRWALPPCPLYTFTASCLGTVSNRANWLQFVFGRCPFRISARTPISLQTFSMFYSVPAGIWRDSSSKLSRDHFLPPLQFTIHDTRLLTASLNKCKQGDITETLLPRGSVKVTCIFVRLYSCPITKESRTVPRWLGVQWPFRMLSGLICASVRECGVLFHVCVEVKHRTGWWLSSAGCKGR